ncbi:unnamed protein product, partial [Arabidopsis halleri]
MLKQNELSVEERQGRWDLMVLEQKLNHKTMMNRLKLNEGQPEDQVDDNMEPHPLGIGYRVMSKVKPRIRATARKSVGGRMTSPVKSSPPCGVCSRTDHQSGAFPAAQPVQPYMVEYVKCYCCGGVGHVSMYCPYIAPRVGEGTSRGA